MRVLNVAYPFAPVGPCAVGGAEQVLALIDEALTRAGMQSFVLGCAGSAASGRLIEAFEVPTAIDEVTRARLHRDYRRKIAETLAAHDLDLVHYHGIDFHEYAVETDVPQLATLHLPPDLYPARIYAQRNIWLHCVSEAQQRRCPASARLLEPIPNGVRLPNRGGIRKRGFAVALGRICPEKGYEHALEAAKMAGVDCVIAGKVFPYAVHERYFAEVLAPRLDRRRCEPAEAGTTNRCRFIGPVGPIAKTRLLSAARCLLVPSLVAETSSLVAMEAMACGTPVIAFPSGALPSLIVDGVTGFVVRDSAEMAKAIHAAAELSPETCRAYAREHFSAERMTNRYLELYGRLIERAGAGIAA